MRHYSRSPFLARSPGTIAAMMPLVLSSDKLMEDVREVRQMWSQREKITRLEEMGRRYALGRFQNAREGGVEHFGVERNETGRNSADGLHVRGC